MSTVDINARILGAPAALPPSAPAATPKVDGPRFDQVLQQQVAARAAGAGLKLSGHAQTRLASRRITLTEGDMARIGDAVTRAAAKGARESLVLTDKAALVVSVPNRTIITAVGRDDLKENIFTNIDSAVII